MQINNKSKDIMNIEEPFVKNVIKEAGESGPINNTRVGVIAEHVAEVHLESPHEIESKKIEKILGNKYLNIEMFKNEKIKIFDFIINNGGPQIFENWAFVRLRIERDVDGFNITDFMHTIEVEFNQIISPVMDADPDMLDCGINTREESFLVIKKNILKGQFVNKYDVEK